MRGAGARRGEHDTRGGVGGILAAHYPLGPIRRVPRQERARAESKGCGGGRGTAQQPAQGYHPDWPHVRSRPLLGQRAPPLGPGSLPG